MLFESPWFETLPRGVILGPNEVIINWNLFLINVWSFIQLDDGREGEGVLVCLNVGERERVCVRAWVCAWVWVCETTLMSAANLMIVFKSWKIELLSSLFGQTHWRQRHIFNTLHASSFQTQMFVIQKQLHHLMLCCQWNYVMLLRRFIHYRTNLNYQAMLIKIFFSPHAAHVCMNYLIEKSNTASSCVWAVKRSLSKKYWKDKKAQ